MKKFTGNIIILGFGSIGSGLVPLLFDHFEEPQITVITADDRNAAIAAEYKIKHVVQAIDEDNYQDILNTYVEPGDFLVNLTVEVDSLSLMQWAARYDVLYVDTVVEPWTGYYTNPNLPVNERTNYWLRQRVIDYREDFQRPNAPTAIIAHGANPGLVNHFVKAGLLEIAEENNITTVPKNRQEWIDLAKQLRIKVIHIAERDTQYSRTPKARDEFVNTWSVEGFIAEGCQAAELGWGSHERELPEDGVEHQSGCGSAIYLNQAGLMTRVRSWTPDEGPMHAWIITHNESISIADYFSGSDYRPTVHYAYHPCDAAVLSMHEITGKDFQEQKKHRIITNEIEDGVDELGVLLMGNSKGSLWYGSNLSIHQARACAKHNNATSLQVTAPVLAAMLWAIENPQQGILEADELPFDEIIETCRPYLGNVVGVWTDWTPLRDRTDLFPQNVDQTDPWQFKNFRVS